MQAKFKTSLGNLTRLLTNDKAKIGLRLELHIRTLQPVCVGSWVSNPKATKVVIIIDKDEEIIFAVFSLLIS